MKLTHQDLISLGALLGYTSMEKGVCQGFSAMWLQAVLAGEENSFYERLQLIAKYKYNFQRLLRKIIQVKQKVREKTPLTDEDKKLLEVLLHTIM